MSEGYGAPHGAVPPVAAQVPPAPQRATSGVAMGYGGPLGQAGGAAPVGAPQQATAPAAPPAPPATRSALRTSAGRAGMGYQREEGDLDIDAALTAMVQAGASDLHLTSGAPPTVRVSGSLQPLDGFDALQPDSLRRTLYAVLTQKQREKFEANLELDLSYSVRGLARFRVNLYQQRESLGAAFRVIPYEIKPLEQLGVPPVVANFAGLPRGLVLVTGPTGSGKSTTLAAIIDLANRTRADHIMTVEDPIEFLHRHKKSLINQREVGEDTHSFASALKHVLRQDPDIILVGELRDLETISVALTAAETGHLVFATLHTQDAAQTIDRIIDVFPANQQAQVRTQLAGALQGVVSQTLCKRADAPGRVVATEVMVATAAIRNLIREGKTYQVYSAMQAGAQHGMHTMDQHLAELVRTGRISYESGLERAHHVEDFNRLTGRFSGVSQGAAGMGAGNGFAGDAFGQAAL
ncbi:type IV pilus twitching motility protein PilT [Cellulomonas hominis]|uniref:type IV pilus twitching motility protein PilT n=1 Tax=Cellulomonas hominis TaxID=156981 RepID=UPI0027E10221|nr:type IV pilus twitching motility protein PilT [Cellulomonas hominis]